MYQKENAGLGCKVRTNTPKTGSSATSSTSQRRGESYDQCSSRDIRFVLNAAELVKSLTTSHQSNRVAIRWRGTTFKRCVIDVTTLKVDGKHINDPDHCPHITKGGR